MRDYHIYTYKAIWAAAVREELVCERLPHIQPTRLYGLQQLERSWCVRGYHIYTYKDIWAAAVGEELVCETTTYTPTRIAAVGEELVCERLPHIHLQGYMGCTVGEELVCERLPTRLYGLQQLG